MLEYKSKEELFHHLDGAFLVKLRLIKKKYNYLKKEDIWNYLKINKWCYDNNLTLDEMTNDIINVDIVKVDLFIKEKLKKEKRELLD